MIISLGHLMMISSLNSYTWNNFNCAYTIHQSEGTTENDLALVLIHPIGVGLSGVFWHRFAETWFKSGQQYTLYNPDLLGCGKSDMPPVCYYPEDWAKQLKYFIETVVKKSVILVVQGALFPVAIRLIQNPPQPNYIKGLALSGPPAWRIMTEPAKPVQQKLLWNLLFNSPVGLGNAFYRYARRRQFLQSFSVRQLFEKSEMVDDEWLDFLQKGATNLNSRYAVFSFLAGFWRQDYSEAIKSIHQPTLVVFGEKASSISKEGKIESPDERLELYLKYLPNGQACKISGRNVMPYESPDEFVSVLANFVKNNQFF
ncbi:alpha/beta hydrolase fold protein [Rippkaea orientalis PCC 8801]|uniref:Alpha/beta hydrolase fold protein n=1 Tax=Rippkaea orientalis (strain PCC 8801 / RF-1) TaxID=41431 RepID=B7JX59_RIPO1|nr:alpha/beta hydrolase [Rippkaea orientalis]ACK67047.1 alpha/beta hydrolase fold protein [Rippkaea orientalis PCC 8801]